MKYDHKHIEKKWQSFWEKHKQFEVEVDKTKPKYYVLDMFPYPSGSGLHVGHVTGYTATDVIARYKRLKGFNVLHPMGWDSFGLQAEQFAIRTGTHPRQTTAKNINTYRRQLKSLGFSYDWKREVNTSDPKYYKWTQWIFTKLIEKGLAFEANILVNYCPQLGTVLANEEVEEGKSKEGGFPVERRPLRQWVLKITHYAERLLDDLDDLDWPKHLKTLQRNWIGKSEGAQINFTEVDSREKITVFTTRAETLFGASFLVISPEHPFVKEFTDSSCLKDVQKYLSETAKKSDFERTELVKDKTGVWTGKYAINPVNEKKIPIWIGDYVLMNYGSGAVMGVPACDKRDFEFAKKYKLLLNPVCIPTATCSNISSEQLCAIKEGYQVWESSGIMVNSCSKHLSLDNLTTEKARLKTIGWLTLSKNGKAVTTYKLRDWLFSRQRYWGEPIPIIHFEDGTNRYLELDELPLLLPELNKYTPIGANNSPLENAQDWVYFTDDKTGLKAKRETNTMPQWAGSCWYYLRYCDPHNSDKAFGEEEENYWMPVDLYVGGVEHAVLHLLYARFWHKVLYDCNIVSTKEPFQKLRNQGLVTAKTYKKTKGGYVSFENHKKHDDVIEMVEKMSKSKFNGVSPDSIVQEFGADTLRLYELFMGPFDKEKLWDSRAITGCRRFLEKFKQLIDSDKVTNGECYQGMRLAHLLVDGVEKDIEGMYFNTAISKMMEFVNAFSKLDSYPKKALQMAVISLSPFAPHLSEECWETLSGEGFLSYQRFPVVDKNMLVQNEKNYAIQINGKFRGQVLADIEITKDALYELALKDPKINRFLSKKPSKLIFVPGKVINIIL